MSLKSKSLLLALASLVTVGVADAAMAQTTASQPAATKAQVSAPAADPAATRPQELKGGIAPGAPLDETAGAEEKAKIWSLSGGVDFTNQYFFRGIKQEDQGLIIQPYGELAIQFYKGEEKSAVQSLSVFGGTWNSIHSGPTGSEDDGGFRDNPKSWYECDMYVGLRAALFDKWSADFFYTCYYSPNASFGAIHELAYKVGFNDSEYLGDFALSPYVLMAYEVSNEADLGNNSTVPGFHQGGYVELGIEPKLDLFKSKSVPITFSFPVKVGLSMYDYYQDASTADSTFGYASLGAWAFLPLNFIPAEAGTWTFAVGGTMMILGNNATEINNDRQLAGIATARLTVSF